MAEIFPLGNETGEKLSYRAYTNQDFEKSAQSIEVSSDVRDWPSQILTEFASEHPYAFRASAPEIEFEKIDEKSGCAFGAIILRKPFQVTGLSGPRERLEQEPEKTAVPIIIENFQLQPFEIFIRGDKVIPLTENRFAEGQAGSPVATGLDPYFQPSPMFMDKMAPPSVAYLGNMYNQYSVGAGEEMSVGKMASADPSKEVSILGQIKNTIRQSDWDNFHGHVGDHRAMTGFSMNKTLNVVKEILGTKPTTFDDYMDFIHKAAPVHLVRLERLSNGRWKATEANDYYFKPVIQELTPKEVVARYSSVEPAIARLVQQEREVLIESPARKHVTPIVLEEHEPVAEEAESDGHILAVTEGGGFIEGQLFTKVLGYDGNVFPAKLFIGGDTYAFQEKLVGEKKGDVYEGLKPGSLDAGVEGTFVGEQDGEQCVLAPFRVTNVGKLNHQYLVAQALGASGEHLCFVLMPGITRYMNATGVADTIIGSHVGANVFFVPPSWHFMAFTKRVRLMSDPREVKKRMGRTVFFPKDRALEPWTVGQSGKGQSRTLRIISEGGGRGLSLRGDILDTIRYDHMGAQMVPMLEAHWILTLLGVSLQECARLTALAVKNSEITVSNLRPAKDMIKRDQIQDKNLADLAAVFRRNLFKESSVIRGLEKSALSPIGDEEAVDAMLSLNFVNENNLIQFMQNVPLFRQVEEKLAELYLYSCLGLKSQIPDQAVLSAMKSLNEVNEHLEYLQSMLRMPESQAQPQPAA